MTTELQFPQFFFALWNREPFPWQTMLAECVAEEKWPPVLDLPTASGKTACLDIAVCALAAQADRPLAERTAPRRIWFVVDRRIVVDEAFERASQIAAKLAEATSGPLRHTADRLRMLSGTDRPLAVARLRGGIFRDDGWARIPSQPAIITSTVDQLGSRLLFRGYGHSLLTAPIFAGLAANDSLIILDEAHCAVPFMQTLEAIGNYRAANWAEEPLPTPFAFVVMSATPPRGVPTEAVFPGPGRARALEHRELRRRFRTVKPAELVSVDDRRGGEDPLVTEAIARTWRFVGQGRRRVAVMVNRVQTARSIADGLTTAAEEHPEADVVLLTGRIRPVERDEVVERWGPYLRANDPEEPARPIVVVSTQCLEVGADFSFDALVTECASLDALRQRFGRLARLGSETPAPAAILIRGSDVDPEEPDPIYGQSLCETWKWLGAQAQSDTEGRLGVDMGVEALEDRLRDVEDLSLLLAPSPDAPTLLPAHLDLLTQTAPVPHPEPDISLYLHGKPAAPEVSVVWRCDLPVEDTQTWLETIALCPPVSAEMLQAPVWRLRTWLAGRVEADDSPDIEGAGRAHGPGEGRARPFLLWRGRDRSRVATDPEEIRPGDVVVVPAGYGIDGLGQASRVTAVGSEGLDLWEVARKASGQPAAVRLTGATLALWLEDPGVKDLLAAVSSPAWDRQTVKDAIEAVLQRQHTPEDSLTPVPAWWRELLDTARSGRIADHPAGGIVLFARPTAPPRTELDLFADDDDLLSATGLAVSLRDHSEAVERAARKLSALCLPETQREAVRLAAYWHDAGKLDERFQVLLHEGDEVAAAAAPEPLAKSVAVPDSPARRRAIREASGLPENFRHEMLSMQLASCFATLPEDPVLADLILHCVASHHGHARPFAPVCFDPSPPAIHGEFGGVQIDIDAETRAAWVPAHRVDSGVPQRFWRLVRRYGWWGLAYLEAIVRLSDWYGSALIIPREENP
jgi:CRISPR-associated endonuclease/helicase Cas3